MSDAYFIEENYELVDITSIDKKSDTRCVYDLEVEDDHTYVLANDIISHNSRAKAGKSMFKETARFCGKYKIPMIYTNHVYKDIASSPNPMYAKNKQAGGQQSTYMSSAVVFLSKRAEKNDDRVVTGNFLIAKTEKNRLAPEGKTIEMYLSFKTGPNKYYGLIDMGIEAGVIKPGNNSKNFIVPHLGEKPIRVTDIYGKRKAEVFNEETLNIIDAYCKQNYTYNTISNNEDDYLNVLIDDNIEDEKE